MTRQSDIQGTHIYFQSKGTTEATRKEKHTDRPKQLILPRAKLGIYKPCFEPFKHWVLLSKYYSDRKEVLIATMTKLDPYINENRKNIERQERGKHYHRASCSAACSFVLNGVMLWSRPRLSIIATQNREAFVFSFTKKQTLSNFVLP